MDKDEVPGVGRRFVELAAREALDPAEDDYPDLLGDLVWKYESEAHPPPSVSGEAMLRHIIRSRPPWRAAGR